MNIPNFLSLFRLTLVPVFAVIFMSSMKHSDLYAGIIFIIAALTDVADGYIARKYYKITKIGRILDPLADKLLQATALACLALKSIIPTSLCLIFIGKELTMILGGVFMVNKMDDVLPSNWFGKTVSFLMTLSIIAAIFLRKITDEVAPGIFNAVFLVVTILAVTALIMYIVKYLMMISKNNKKTK